MKYPDILKIYFVRPKRKLSPERFKQFKNIVDNFEEVMVIHSDYYDSGISYYVVEVARWNSGEITLWLNRKDDDVVPDNLKQYD